MSTDAWERVESIFAEALDCEPSQREALLRERCGEDRGLFAEVTALLESHGAIESESFLPHTDALREWAERDEVPPQVGPYRILEELGRGGMGVVYRAEQPMPRREVAVKVVRDGILAPLLQEQLKGEIAILGQLSHSNIAQVFEAGALEQGGSYIAMELIDGKTILDYTRDQGLDIPGGLALCIGVAEGVCHAHDNGVIHRDLKPANVLVTAEGVPKILDFGIAATSEAHLSRTRQAAGTPAFMSPERSENPAVAPDVREDVFAMGRLFEHLLSRCCGSVPFDLRRVVEMATHPDPDGRYPNGQSLLDDLHRWQQKMPVVAAGGGLAYRARKWAVRHPVLLLLGLIAAAAVSVGSWLQRDLQQSWEDVARQETVTTDRDRVRALLAEVPAMRVEGHRSLVRLERWIEEAEDLDRRLRAALKEREESAQVSTRLAGQADVIDLDALRDTVETELTQLLDPDPSGPGLGRMEELLQSGRDLWAKTVDGPEVRTAWEDARQRIRDSKIYGGLDLPPQLGLVPLGSNPYGLWEFLVAGSGRRARPGKHGHLEPHRDSGIVLILVPTGKAYLGAQSQERENPNFDLDARGDEFKRWREWSCEQPYFLSKFEWTGEQSRETLPRVIQIGPARVMTTKGSGRLGDLPYPRTNLDPRDVPEVLRKVGLRLPTLEEWEYAARAGTSTPWSTDPPRLSSLQLVANLGQPGGRSAASHRVLWQDGYEGVAPIGSFRPNPWGFFDVHGNVAELVRGTDPVTGKLTFEARGGSFRHGPKAARSSRWIAVRESSEWLGVRVARSVYDLPQD